MAEGEVDRDDAPSTSPDDRDRVTDKILNKLSNSHIKSIDRLYWDPRERAQGVHNIIEAKFRELEESGIDRGDLPSSWDRFCYAVEFSAQTAVAVDDPRLTEVVKNLVTWLYSAHYSNAHQLYGAPDRKED